MPPDEMNFIDHLRQFFDDEVAGDELKLLAVHAIANDVRRLKPAISQAVWDARQLSLVGGGNAEASAVRLNEARQLHSMYAEALNEYRQLTETKLPVEVAAGHSESTFGGTNDDSGSTREHF